MASDRAPKTNWITQWAISTIKLQWTQLLLTEPRIARLDQLQAKTITWSIFMIRTENESKLSRMPRRDSYLKRKQFRRRSKSEFRSIWSSWKKKRSGPPGWSRTKLSSVQRSRLRLWFRTRIWPMLISCQLLFRPTVKNSLGQCAHRLLKRWELKNQNPESILCRDQAQLTRIQEKLGRALSNRSLRATSRMRML